jgi:hypothetical protein
MHSINHAALGAVIGLVTKDPLIAIPAAFASHFVLDALPHYGIRGDEGYAALFKQWQSYPMVIFDIELKDRRMKGNILTKFHQKIQWGERSWGIYIEIPFAIILLWEVAQLA